MSAAETGKIVDTVKCGESVKKTNNTSMAELNIAALSTLCVWPLVYLNVSGGAASNIRDIESRNVLDRPWAKRFDSTWFALVLCWDGFLLGMYIDVDSRSVLVVVGYFYFVAYSVGDSFVVGIAVG